MSKKINIPAFIVTIIYPLLIFTLSLLYILKFGLHKFEIITIIASYYICNISVGIGLHRLWAHGSYKTNKYVELTLAITSAATLQGPILAWASDHIVHHMHTDKEKDPHSALKYKNKFLGFLWSHMGWMIFNDPQAKKIDRIALVKLGRNKIVSWQFKNYWKIAIIMNTVLPLVLGFIIGGSIHYAIASFIFVGLGRALQQQATFCVNSLVHLGFGGKKYYYGTARDMWFLFPMLLGENWHNFHHAFASDYRNGHKWYHADVHKWIIALMGKVGLARNLIITSETRIENMVNEVKNKSISNIHNKLDLIEKATKHIEATTLRKIKTAEKLALDIKESLQVVLERSINILNNIEVLKDKINSIEEKILAELLEKYETLHRSATKLNISTLRI